MEVPYGLTDEPLTPGLHFPKTESVGANYKIGNFTISGTGNISITGVGFTPKLVEFVIGDNSGSVNAGVGAMTATAQHCLNISLGTVITSQCIYYGNPVKARAVYVSMDSDGFTINCTYFSATTNVLYKCFG